MELSTHIANSTIDKKHNENSKSYVPAWNEVDTETLKNNWLWEQVNKKRAITLFNNEWNFPNSFTCYENEKWEQIIDLRKFENQWDTKWIKNRIEYFRNSISEIIHIRLSDIDLLNQIPTIIWSWWQNFISMIEQISINVSAVTADNPYWYCAKNLKKWGLNQFYLEWNWINWKSIEAIKLTKTEHSFTSQSPQASKHKEKWLHYIHTFNMWVMEYNQENGWSKTKIIPSSRASLAISDTTAIQYAQSIFEWLVATMKDWKVSIFRIEQNAKRIIKWMIALWIPIINEEQFIKSIIEIVKTNISYIPKDMRDWQLYIRPSVFWVEWWAWAISANKFIFSIEVFPYWVFLWNPSDDAIEIEARLDIARPPTWSIKCAANYWTFFKTKSNAKKRGYNDIISLSDWKVEEASSSSVFFIKKTWDDNYCLITSKVWNGNNSLESITRKSIIILAEKSWIKVKQRDVDSNEIGSMHWAFTTWTAAWISRIKAIDLKNWPLEKDDPGINRTEFTDPWAVDVISTLHKLLMQARTWSLEWDLADLNDQWTTSV